MNRAQGPVEPVQAGVFRAAAFPQDLERVAGLFGLDAYPVEVAFGRPGSLELQEAPAQRGQPLLRQALELPTRPPLDGPVDGPSRARRKAPAETSRFGGESRPPFELIPLQDVPILIEAVG